MADGGMSVADNKQGNQKLDLVFDDNRLAGALFGEFDQNLALVEKRIGVDAVARGNTVTLSGTPDDVSQAQQVLESLYDRLMEGHDIASGDVEGAIRMAKTPELQHPVPIPDESPHRRFSSITTRKRSVVARTPMQDAYIRAMERSELVIGIGPAGTGKTYLAVALAAAYLERGKVDRIILSRPAVEAGERLGFLPGDMKDKVDPYLRPLYDALYDMMAVEKIERGLQSGVIEVAPLAFMRGRTLAHCVIILDEAQNTTPMQMKMFLTRLGENAKMIVTGDPSQTDLPPGQVSGLRQATRILKDIGNIDIIRFTGADVVRHRLVQDIVAAYDRETGPSGDQDRGGQDR